MADKPKPFPERGALSAKFRATTPAHWRAIIGDAEKTREVRAFEERLAATRRRVAEHHSRHKARWIDQEFARIVLAKMALAPVPRPRGVRVNLQEYRAEAARRVAARHEARKARLDRAHDNMVSRVMLGREAARREPAKLSAAEYVERVHETVARAQRLRAVCTAHFEKHRKEWVEAAEAGGAANPHGDIARKQFARLDRITKAEASILREASTRDGREYVAARTDAAPRHVQSM